MWEQAAAPARYARARLRAAKVIFEGAAPSDLLRELNATERNTRAVLFLFVLDPHHAL